MLTNLQDQYFPEDFFEDLNELKGNNTSAHTIIKHTGLFEDREEIKTGSAAIVVFFLIYFSKATFCQYPVINGLLLLADKTVV